MIENVKDLQMLQKFGMMSDFLAICPTFLEFLPEQHSTKTVVLDREYPAKWIRNLG